MIKLKALRIEKGLNQQDVADFLGISQPAYANYERQAREADYETLKKLSTFFGVSIDYLLGKEDEPTLDEQLDGVEFALFGEIHDLTEEEKRDILSYVQFKKSQRGE